MQGRSGRKTTGGKAKEVMRSLVTWAIHTDRRKKLHWKVVSLLRSVFGVRLCKRPERQDQLQREREDPVIRTSRCGNFPSF